MDNLLFLIDYIINNPKRALELFVMTIIVLTTAALLIVGTLFLPALFHSH